MPGLFSSRKTDGYEINSNQKSIRLGGRVVMQRPAKPWTPVRFRPQPPFFTFRIDKALTAPFLFGTPQPTTPPGRNLSIAHVGQKRTAGLQLFHAHMTIYFCDLITLQRHQIIFK